MCRLAVRSKIARVTVSYTNTTGRVFRESTASSLDLIIIHSDRTALIFIFRMQGEVHDTTDIHIERAVLTILSYWPLLTEQICGWCAALAAEMGPTETFHFHFQFVNR